MYNKIFSLSLMVVSALLSACNPVQKPALSATPTSKIANPASVFCEQQGGQSRIVTAADGSQGGLCIFPDGSSCDEWAFFRGECGPTGQVATPAPSATPIAAPTSIQADIPTPGPINPDWYQGWLTYVNTAYGFSLQLPPDWVVDEITSSDPQMNGHMLKLHIQQDVTNGLTLRVTFRQLGQEYLLWPTGIGEGSFVSLGNLQVAGQAVRRMVLVCPAGQVDEAWYQGPDESSPNLRVDSLEFGFILGYETIHCQEGYSLGGKDLMVGDMMVASLKLP